VGNGEDEEARGGNNGNPTVKLWLHHALVFNNWCGPKYINFALRSVVIQKQKQTGDKNNNKNQPTITVHKL
jgi:hypothetical protein